MSLTETAPAGTLRKLARKRARMQDDLVADYVSTVIRPGDRSLQLGRSQFGATCLARGAFHEVIASDAAMDALKRECQNREVSLDRLTCQREGDSQRAQLDLVIIGKATGFSALASNWKTLAERLKIGGVLVINGVDRGAVARLADALFTDADWVFQDMIGGEAAVYRRIRRTQVSPQHLDIAEKNGVARERRSGGLMAGVIRTLFNPRGDRQRDLNGIR